MKRPDFDLAGIRKQLEGLQDEVRALGPAPLRPGDYFRPGEGMLQRKTAGIVSGREDLVTVMEELVDTIWNVGQTNDPAKSKNLVDLITYRTKLPESVVRKGMKVYYKQMLLAAKAKAEPAAAPVSAPAPAVEAGMPTGEPDYQADPYADVRGEVPPAEQAPEKIAPTPEKTATAPIATPAAVAPSAPAAGAPTAKFSPEDIKAMAEVGLTPDKVVEMGAEFSVERGLYFPGPMDDMIDDVMEDARNEGSEEFTPAKPAQVAPAPAKPAAAVDAVVAVAKIDSDGNVKGGTAYAVEAAIMIPGDSVKVYVYDLNDNTWYTYEKGAEPGWAPIESPPTEFKQIAGIGTRTKDLTPAEATSMKAAIDAYVAKLDPSVVIHSGGAEGADTMFENAHVARGGKVIAHSFEGAATKSKNALVHTADEIKESDKRMDAVRERLGRSRSDKAYVNNLIARNFFQIFPGASKTQPKQPSASAFAPKPSATPIDRTAGGAVQIKPVAGMNDIPGSGATMHYTFTLIPQDAVTTGTVKGFIIHSGTPGVDGYPMPARPGDKRSNLRKILSGERSATTRATRVDLVPNAKVGDVINVGKTTPGNQVFVQLTGKYQILAFDRRTGLVAMKDITTGQMSTMSVQDMAASEGYDADSYARSVRSMSKVPERNIPKPIQAKTQTPVAPFEAPATPPAASFMPQAAAPAPSPAAVAAPAPSTPGAAFAPNPDALRNALAIQDPALKAEILSALLASPGAAIPAQVAPAPQIAPEQAVAGLPAPSEAIPAAPAPVITPETLISAPAASLPDNAEVVVPGPVPKTVGRALEAMRGPKLKLSNLQPSFEDPIENNFINAYIELLEASAKLAKTDESHKQIDPGAHANIRALMDKKTKVADKIEAQSRFLQAYSVRGKYLVSLIMAGKAPGKNPGPAVTAMFTSLQSKLAASLQDSGVSSRALTVAAGDMASTGAMFGRGLDKWHESPSATQMDQAIDQTTALLDHFERKPMIFAQNSDYVPLIQRTIASIVQNAQTLNDTEALDYNAFYEKGKFTPFNYGLAIRDIYRGGAWAGLDWDKVSDILDRISVELTETGAQVLSISPELESTVKDYIPEYDLTTDPEEKSAELKKFVRRLSRTVQAYALEDKYGRRSGIRDLWFDLNGYITPEQQYLDGYGFGPDYAMDKAATINYYPGLENAPALFEASMRDGFNDFTKRHPWIFPVERAGEIRSSGFMDIITIDDSTMGDYETPGGVAGIFKKADDLTRSAIRRLGNIKILMITNVTEDTVEYDLEVEKDRVVTKVPTQIKPGKTHFVLDEQIAPELESLRQMGFEIAEMPSDLVGYRPTVNSELSVVDEQYDPEQRVNGFGIARASGLGALEDVLDSSQEMNGFAKLMPRTLSPYSKDGVETYRMITANAFLEPQGTIEISVQAPRQFKLVDVPERKTGQPAPTITIDNTVVTVKAKKYALVPDETVRYVKVSVPVELFNPELDPNHPLLQNPKYADIKRKIDAGNWRGAMTMLPDGREVNFAEVMAPREFDLQGDYEVVLRGKYPGAPIVEGIGVTGDQEVSESVAQQYDENAEFRKFRKAQLLGATEGGLPVDETTNILADIGPREVNQHQFRGDAIEYQKGLVLRGLVPAVSIEEIDKLLNESSIPEDIKPTRRKMMIERMEKEEAARVTAKKNALIPGGVTSAAARRASSSIRVQPLEELYDGNMGEILVNRELQEALIKAAKSDTQLVEQLLKQLLRIEAYSARKLHYYSVARETNPQNQDIDGARVATQNIINFIKDRPELRQVLYTAEIARASDVVFGSLKSTPGRQTFGYVIEGPEDTNGSYTISTNPAIIAYGSKKKESQQDISIAWKLATDFEQKFRESIEQGVVSIDTPRQYVDDNGVTRTESTDVPDQAAGQTGFGKMDKEELTRPSKRGETLGSLLRGEGYSMQHMENIVKDNSLVQANGPLFEEMGIAEKDEDGSYYLKENAKIEMALPPGTRLKVPVDQSVLDARERSRKFRAVEGAVVTDSPAKVDPKSPSKPTKAKPQEPVDYKNIINQYLVAIAARRAERAVAIDQTERDRLSLRISDLKNKIQDAINMSRPVEFKAGEPVDMPEVAKVSKPAFAWVDDPQTALANMAVRNPARAKRVLDLAHNIMVYNIGTQRKGVIGQLIRILETQHANQSAASAIKSLGYIELPENVQAEADPSFVESITRYPELVTNSDSEGAVYVIDDFGQHNKVFNGSVEVDYNDDGEIPMWKHVSKYIEKNQTMLVYTVDPDGTGRFGIMPVVSQPSANGGKTYIVAPEVVDNRGMSFQEMTEALTSMGLDKYVDTYTEIPVPPDLPLSMSDVERQAAMAAYSAELTAAIEKNNMSPFDVQIAQGRYTLGMNRDYFVADSRLHDVPESSLFDGAISNMFYQEVSGLISQDPRVDLSRVLPAIIVDENGRVVPPEEGYGAFANDAKNRIGVIKARTIASMSKAEKVVKRKVVLGAGDMDLLTLREANAMLTAERRMEFSGGGAGGSIGSVARAQQILDSAIMKAEAAGFNYQKYDEAKAFDENGPKTGPTNVASKFSRYGKGVLRGTTGAVALMALINEMKNGSSDENEQASLEGLYNKGAQYAPLVGMVAGTEAISRLPVPAKFGGGLATAGLAGGAMLGYTALTGGDILRTAIGLLGGTVGGIAGGLATGGAGALPGSIAGGLFADEMYSKITGKNSTFDMTPTRRIPRNVAKKDTEGDTRSLLESEFTSKGGFGG